MKDRLRWEAFALPPRRRRYRLGGAESAHHTPARVQSTLYLDDGCLSPLTFFLTADQADELASKLADAAAAARAMPVENLITDLDQTKDESERGTR